MLDMTRMRAGKLRLNPRRVDLTGVVRAAVEAVRPAVEAKNLQLNTVLDPEAGAVRADPDRLQQVVWNLLTNATKFTPPRGKINVDVRRFDGDIEIRVSDTGKGIGSEFLPHVFKRFRQAEGAGGGHQTGLGLGLAICKELVELHGGTISAQSAGPGKGATFTVRLPLARLDPVLDAVGGEAPAQDQKLDGIRILLLEDERDSRNALQAVLRQAAAEVTAVESARAALASLTDSSPDIIVSDIGMAEMDGLEFIRRVRLKEMEKKSSNVPALALTAFGADEDHRRAIAAGFTAHISKPVDPAFLLSTVRSLLRSS